MSKGMMVALTKQAATAVPMTVGIVTRSRPVPVKIVRDGPCIFRGDRVGHVKCGCAGKPVLFECRCPEIGAKHCLIHAAGKPILELHFDDGRIEKLDGEAYRKRSREIVPVCALCERLVLPIPNMPRKNVVLSDTGLGDVTLNCWYPEATLNVPANRVDVARLFGAATTDAPGQNLRDSWQPELRAREPRIDFRARWYGVTEIRRPAVHLDAAAVEWAKTLRVPGRKLVLFAPHSKQVEREWPAGHWIALGEMLGAQGVQVLMDLGRADAGLEEGPWRTFVGQAIPRLAALIGEADLTVAIDSGPAHVSGTMDRPTLLLLGPLLENSYEHMGSVQTIRSGRGCGGCNLQAPNYVRRCHGGCRAMYDLWPAVVAARVARMLTPTSIGVCCLATNEIADVRDVTRPNLEAYCHRHGYALHYLTEANSARPASWTKILAMECNLEAHEWLWWADADLVVSGPTRRLEELTDGAAGDLLIASDANGINCGSFLLRNCAWSHDFLRRVWDTAEDVNHEWWEQWAIMRLLAASPADRAHVQSVRKRRLNAYPSDWRPGDFVLHTPGLPDRVRILRAALEA